MTEGVTEMTKVTQARGFSDGRGVSPLGLTPHLGVDGGLPDDANDAR